MIETATPSPARTRKIVPVVLAGGSGTRLWPLSRTALPKQFLPLAGSQTLYQDTLLRVAPGALYENPIVVTNEDFRFFAQRQARDVGVEAQVLLEPARRDSAPALIAAAAHIAQRHGADALVLALASDHIVLDPVGFNAAVAVAAEVAARQRIVTFGIVPTSPRTSYGYVQRGQALDYPGAYEVSRFVEKPDLATAERYVAEGYLWNSGNFLFPASLLLSEAERFQPKVVEAARAALAQATYDLGFVRLDPSAFAAAPAISIDFAVLEHTRHAAIVESSFGWSDVGSWDALYEIAPKDEAGNVALGPVQILDSADCYIRSEGPLIAAVGLQSVSVIATPDAVLVLPAHRSQDVKPLVAALKADERPEVDLHPTTYRPWGSYQAICRGDRFQVKKITVEPGGILSLQKHHHRAEHWVVVHGTAEVTLGERTFNAFENESIYIPTGSVHRLANPGRIPLELIEVQTGSYLGEDDILRLEDIYQRS